MTVVGRERGTPSTSREDLGERRVDRYDQLGPTRVVYKTCLRRDLR